MQHELPKLPYDYDALEPHIDAQTMEIHHGKHHAAYVKNLNAALEGHSEFEGKTLEELLRECKNQPDFVQMQIRNNGGGHFNHSLFWEVMGSPPPAGGSGGSGGEPQGKLAEAINSAFGSFSGFKEQFTKAAAARFGSGWSWLFLNSEEKLEITSMPNQDSPIMDGMKPILGLDVWEHAYYLKYQNKRPDYINAWWNVINWAEVERKFSV